LDGLWVNLVSVIGKKEKKVFLMMQRHSTPYVLSNTTGRNNFKNLYGKVVV
jgi:hypothetical protein